MKDVYVLATQSPEPIDPESIREVFEGEGVEFITGEPGTLFCVRGGESSVEVRFVERRGGLGVAPDLLTGSEVALRTLEAAEGFYRFAFAPGKPQASVAVFETLWCVRTVLERVSGVVIDVTSFKVHMPEDVEEITELDFDIRDHLTLHAVEMTVDEGKKSTWVHSHGMSKFHVGDVEVFNLHEDDLQAAETFFYELCTDLAFGQGPALREVVGTSVGEPFMMLPCEEARQALFGAVNDQFDGHEGGFNTVVSAEGRHSVGEILKHYRDRYLEESAEEAARLQAQATELLPAFKARFLRRGLMEPLTFVVRAPFEIHPEGEAEAAEERLWVEVLHWEDTTLIGKVVDGGDRTTEWRKGAHVEVDEDQVNAISLAREGRALDDDEMRSILVAERPM